MTRNPCFRRTAQALSALLATGTLFSGSCSTDSLRAVVAGIDAVTSSLDQSISNRDLTFGEWLLLGLEN